MPLNLSDLSRLRPYLYHLTARQNIDSIEREGELRCARLLLTAASLEHRSTERRLDHLPLTVNSNAVLIRDQKPLAAGAIQFEDGWTLERFVQHVNEHVFFWPGTSAGPIRSGLNHYARYAEEKPVILRFRTDLAAQTEFAFSRYNSGAPRCSGGRYSPRGSQTYLRASQFLGNPSDVIEVVTKGVFQLPADAEISDSPSGPWRALKPS